MVLHFALKQELGRGNARGHGEPVRCALDERAEEALEVMDEGDRQVPATRHRKRGRGEGKRKIGLCRVNCAEQRRGERGEQKK